MSLIARASADGIPVRRSQHDRLVACVPRSDDDEFLPSDVDVTLQAMIGIPDQRRRDHADQPGQVGLGPGLALRVWGGVVTIDGG